jgi:Fe-S-cluster-containing hydrogenase component 2
LALARRLQPLKELLAKVPQVSERSSASTAAAAAAKPLRSVSPEHQEVYRGLREYPIFDGLPNDVLQEAIASGELRVERYWRDDIVADGATLRETGPAIYLVKSGQVAVAVFPLGLLEKERAEYAQLSEDEKQKKVRTQGPMISLSEKNLATFGEGDLFNSEAIPSADPERCAFYCVAPCELLVFSKGRLAALTARYDFFANRLRRAVEVSKNRLSGISGIKQEILDFFVRHGLSVAETLRVRQIDRCIECKECEKACEARYGHKRLTIHGPRLGMLDFVYACRTCTDQRCLSPCNYDSIKFDARKREVVINESTCTGCAACANACPYGSIEMVDLESPREKLFKNRLEKDGSLKFGEGAGRKVAAAKIASKCDHCSGYGDQACVSHCPTGALVEIKPADLFQDKGEVARQAARAGFDQTVMLDSREMLPSDPFSKGLGITDGADAKVKPRRVHPGVLWGIGLGAFLLALVEIALRLWKPALSLQYASFRLSGLEPEISKIKVNYRPGCDLAVWLGYVGTALMVIALLYPLWKRSRLMQKIGSSQAWFDWHLMGGVVGPLFIVLHSAMKLDNWVSVAFWSMMLVVVSGLVGRYLYTQVPEMLHGRELEELDHERALAKLRGVVPDAVRIVDDEMRVFRARVVRMAGGGIGLATAFFWVVFDDLARPYRWLRRKLRLAGTSAPKRTRTEIHRRAGALMLLERRRLLVPRAHSWLLQWRQVHVPFTFVMMAVSIVHILVALTYSM